MKLPLLGANTKACTVRASYQPTTQTAASEVVTRPALGVGAYTSSLGTPSRELILKVLCIPLGFVLEQCRQDTLKV